jgi:hypothetical protein
VLLSVVQPGDKGTVITVDKSGSIDVAWDNGVQQSLSFGTAQVNRIEHEHGDEDIYPTGGAFWRDTAMRFGVSEAYGICGRYLKLQAKNKVPGERTFCDELILSMKEHHAGLGGIAAANNEHRASVLKGIRTEHAGLSAQPSKMPAKSSTSLILNSKGGAYYGA